LPVAGRGSGGPWLVAITLLSAFVVAKGIACWAAARLTGETPRMAWAIGTLMNARGLMGMLIAGVGLQKGVIDPALYSLLVLMAVITTLMMSPLFDRIYGRADRQPS